MGKRELVTEQPRYIKLNERDNVAIVVNDFGLPAGSRFPCGLELRAFVPQGHKMALVDIAGGCADPALWRSHRLCGLAHSRRRLGRRSAHPNARRAGARQARNRDRRAQAAPAAGRLHVRRLSQRRRLGRHQEHSRHLDHGAVRHGHAGICDQAHPHRIAAEISRTSTTSSRSPMPMAAASRSSRPTPWCRSARCKTSLSIRISAAR